MSYVPPCLRTSAQKPQTGPSPSATSYAAVAAHVDSESEDETEVLEEGTIMLRLALKAEDFQKFNAQVQQQQDLEAEHADSLYMHPAIVTTALPDDETETQDSQSLPDQSSY